MSKRWKCLSRKSWSDVKTLKADDVLNMQTGSRLYRPILEYSASNIISALQRTTSALTCLDISSYGSDYEEALHEIIGKKKNHEKMDGRPTVSSAYQI